MSLSREAILNKSKVEPFGYDGSILFYLRVLKVKELTQITQILSSLQAAVDAADTTKKIQAHQHLKDRFCELCICDEHGERILNDGDGPELPTDINTAVYTAAWKLNGMPEADEKKDSNQIESSD